MKMYPRVTESQLSKEDQQIMLISIGELCRLLMHSDRELEPQDDNQIEQELND